MYRYFLITSFPYHLPFLSFFPYSPYHFMSPFVFPCHFPVPTFRFLLHGNAKFTDETSE